MSGDNTQKTGYVILFNASDKRPITEAPKIGDSAVDAEGNNYGRIVTAYQDPETKQWGCTLEEGPQMGG